jgi:hypothetical protein
MWESVTNADADGAVQTGGMGNRNRPATWVTAPAQGHADRPQHARACLNVALRAG